MSYDPYQNQSLAAQLGSMGAQGIGQYPNSSSRTPKRQRLEDRKKTNNDMIISLTKQNTEIDEALELLNSQPLLERLDNIITKLFG